MGRKISTPPGNSSGITAHCRANNNKLRLLAQSNCWCSWYLVYLDSNSEVVYSEFILLQWTQLLNSQLCMPFKMENLTTKFSTCDIEQLTGILMNMGLVPMSRDLMYWSRAFRLEGIASRMSRFRYFELMKYLHFNENSKAILNREKALHTIGFTKFVHCLSSFEIAA
ncbi:hypothetical protein T11_11045 [Trichinella zimbabwensis]|uniref:PiggyBac transposable element-derived protein domain-containing protein n=1 Tax=Trichinella zimbabwensis TaxID=268475 RepID=A0A0V1GPL8_9BILA|nr:hypothetical protein T11_9368 [Trichinella zimbabwensis]KRZ01357.1 hypothetical protein T11_11045 [Trichinella zimbabwensis]